MPLDAVQETFDLGDDVDRIWLSVESNEVRDAVRKAVAARLPEGFVVQAPVNQMQLADDVLRTTELALRFAGALSMAMAAFVVLNTLRMNFGERRRDMAVLRVLGVTSRQMVGLHLVEGLTLGLIGSAVGIPLGFALGRGLGVLMQSMLADADVPAPPVPYWTLPAALIVGPLVASIAALLPALQSRNISPVEAMGDSETRRSDRLPLWATLAGLAMWSLAVGVLVLVVLERLSPEAAIPAGVLMIVAFIVIIPALLVPLVRLLARLLRPVAPTEGDFAAEQLLERPTRTGLTVGVLVVAISTSLGMGNAIVNNVDDVRDWYRRSMAGDIFVSGAAPMQGSFEAGDPHRIRTLIAADPAVDRVVEMRYYFTRANGVPTACVVRDFPQSAELPWNIGSQDASELTARLREGEVAIGSVLARRLDLKPGDMMRIEIQGRLLSLRVAGVVRDYTLGGLVAFLDTDTAAKLVELGTPDVYLVKPKDSADAAALTARLQKLLGDEGLSVQSYAELRGQFDRLINGIVAALWGLLAIGFVIGGVAVGNTLTMSVLEQTRELGLLRIIGMTRNQVRKLIFCESFLLGVLGTLLGTLAGLITAWVIHLCNEPLIGQAVPFSLHYWLLAANVGTCLAITMLAAWSPGERAARLNVLEAITYE